MPSLFGCYQRFAAVQTHGRLRQNLKVPSDRPFSVWVVLTVCGWLRGRSAVGWRGELMPVGDEGR